MRGPFRTPDTWRPVEYGLGRVRFCSWAIFGGLLFIIALIGVIFTAIFSANHALMDSMVANESPSQEDIIVICPNCESEVNVGTDEDDLYECPSCGQDFEF